MELSGAERGGYANIGERRLAKLSRVDRRSLREIISRLEEFKHVEVEKGGTKVRTWYHLTSAIFAKQAVAEPDSAAEVAIAAPLLTCPKCGKRVGGLLKVGWCRSCNWVVKMDPLVRRVVRQEIAAEKTA
jgi:hypothetical protein